MFHIVGTPVVFVAFGVGDGIFAVEAEGGGEHVVVVEEALGIAEAGVDFKGVVVGDPFEGGFDLGGVLGESAVDEGFDEDVGVATDCKTSLRGSMKMPEITALPLIGRARKVTAPATSKLR